MTAVFWFVGFASAQTRVPLEQQDMEMKKLKRAQTAETKGLKETLKKIDSDYKKQVRLAR